MSRSGDLIDFKVFEADFFLEKLRAVETDFLAARFYFSAYVSAARSITFALQAVLRDVPGFDEWYMGEQAKLRANRIARFFVEVRNESQKLGLTPLNRGTSQWRPDGKQEVKYYFAGGFEGDGALVPEVDVVEACSANMTLLVQLIYDAYDQFNILSPVSFFSVDNLIDTNLSIEEVEEALGFPRGWTAGGDLPVAERLDLLRQAVPDTAIDRVFLRYLGKERSTARRNSN
ncbi:MAG TPA: hypothetical protein VII66_00980 [Gemmatimonadaceae bacterium]